MNQASNVVLSMDSVSMMFRRGELHDSLRDLIPALARRIRRRRSPRALTAQEFWALHDVSFAVERGEAFGIIGSNGAGKSTILKLLSGIMRPTRGKVSVRGRLSALIEVGAGFHPDLTGRENIHLNGTILGMTKGEISRKFDAIVDFAGLGEFIDTPVKRYSSGMYARLGFSVAAHVEPDLLIVDEVLSVGDYLFQQKCVDRMTEILRSGATVVFVSHNLHAVAGLCKRSLLLEKGRVVTCTYTDEVIRQYLERAHEQRPDSTSAVEIRKVALRHSGGSGSHCTSGDKLFVDVTLAARESCSNVTTVIQIVDENFYPIFDTCTARLTGDVATLHAGDEFEATFEINLHLAAGTYHVNVYAHNYVKGNDFSNWRTAATFFVGETRLVKGRANLYPQLESCYVRTPEGTKLSFPGSSPMAGPEKSSIRLVHTAPASPSQ
jgi:homopolymeric O-antigen transport system ATP-binding protein